MTLITCDCHLELEIMLSWKIFQLFFILTQIILFTKTERRIIGGKNAEKEYMVYLVKNPISPREYDGWVCGGTIVSSYFIITSAACVEDVHHLYAIAGYYVYVPSKDLENNECTIRYKKRVVYTCVPRSYELDFDKAERWSFIDIALVKVETPYNFTDTGYQEHCSYIPKAIGVNFIAENEEPGVETVVLGWGHSEKWRKPGDLVDYNQEHLKSASTVIYEKNECKKYFADNEDLLNVIDQYMICTFDNMDIPSLKSRRVADGCTPRDSGKGNKCQEDEDILSRKTFSKIFQRQQSRRNGICQNDHGGPLITWIDGKEVVIGVTSLFRVTNQSTCTGPYLYTSTYNNSAFIKCVLGTENNTRREAICDQPPSTKGFDTIERTISWLDHPNDSANNETPTVPSDEYAEWSEPLDKKTTLKSNDEYEEWKK